MESANGFLDRDGLKRVFSLLDKDFFTKDEVLSIIDGVLPQSGDTGQILTKTDGGVEWRDNLKNWKGSMEEFNKITQKDDDCIYFIKDTTLGDEGGDDVDKIEP